MSASGLGGISATLHVGSRTGALTARDSAENR